MEKNSEEISNLLINKEKKELELKLKNSLKIEINKNINLIIFYLKSISYKIEF